MAEQDGKDSTATETRSIPITGEIIIDAKSYLEHVNEESAHAMGDMKHDSVETNVDIDFYFSAFNRRMDAMPDDILLLLPRRLLGFATRERLWAQFFVDSMSPPPAPELNLFYERLQLEQMYKDLLAALFLSHMPPHMDDIIQGKEKGVVLLLHGPSGVGKTLTAEVIAEALCKPLLSASVTEIGLDVSRAERTLEKLFLLATRWEAVLLVDEIDVLLEMGAPNAGGARNALTSVFLRALDRYRGIIVLTTNRAKFSIDEAIISRIHLAIPYHHLDDGQTHTIFKHFLDQLDPKMILDRKSIDEFVADTGHHYGLDGRQIRHIVRFSLALARHEAARGQGDARVTRAHVQKLCKITREFRERLGVRSLAQRYNGEPGDFGGSSEADP